MENLYVICDHTRALGVQLTMASCPATYERDTFTRMLVRRALRAIRHLDMSRSLADIVGVEIDYFSPYFPEPSQKTVMT